MLKEFSGTAAWGGATGTSATETSPRAIIWCPPLFPSTVLTLEWAACNVRCVHSSMWQREAALLSFKKPEIGPEVPVFNNRSRESSVIDGSPAVPDSLTPLDDANHPLLVFF